MIGKLTYVSCDEMKLSLENVIFNKIHERTNCIANMICLIVKYYLYRIRCMGENLNVCAFEREISSIHNIEKYIAVKNDKLFKHQKKWWSTSDNEGGTELNNNMSNFVMEYPNNMDLR